MHDPAFPSRVGATFRGVINDLKRNTEAAAADLGVEPAVLDRIIDGDGGVPPEILAAAVRSWPVNERDFFPVHDDAPDGVRIMRAAESATTSRVFQRGGADYYEYRDTAMSRLAMFRPEWIRMLQPVTDDDPDNPAVRWNNGHFLYQFTYFIGDVNYYYEWAGRRYCVPMRTGDSVSGLPYAPHSFAYRAGGSGLILALTYGGRLLGDAQHELGALGADLAEGYAAPLVDEAAASGRILRERLDDCLYPASYLAGASGVPAGRLDELLAGRDTPTPDELTALAAALRVPVRDLLPVVGQERDGVQIVPAHEAPSWTWPDGPRPAYRVKALAGTRLCPDSRALEIDVLGSDAPAATLHSGLHQYCYVLGPEPVRLRWRSGTREFDELLTAGDSLYLKPFVPHSFTRPDGGGAPNGTAAGDTAAGGTAASGTASGRATVLALRIGGKVSGDTRREAAALGRDTLRRLVSDTGQWYDPGDPGGNVDPANQNDPAGWRHQAADRG